MSELRELYQELVLDHNSKPRNFRELESPTTSIEGYNPLCGDRVTIYVKLDKDRIEDLSFQGQGCAISRASASMMTQALKDKSIDEAERLFNSFHGMVTGTTEPSDDHEDLGDLFVLSGVSEFPARVKCATLSWHSMISALKGQGAPVSTE